MGQRAAFLIAYAAAHGPATVRQLHYRAEVEAVPGIDKTESSYSKVQRQVLSLRRAGKLPYRHIADLTRWMRKPTTFDSVTAALQETARHYRKALWLDAEVYIEVWCEKDALAGVIFPITSLYDVPLMVARGFTSETFCFEAVEARVGDPRPYIIYYLGDCDRSGRDAAAALKEKLERFAGERKVRVEFLHLAIAEDDIIRFDAANSRIRVAFILNGYRFDKWLPTREPKRKSPADKLWPHPFACELDAIEPDDLRSLVRAAIEHHLPADQLRILQIAEENEREAFQSIATFFLGDPESFIGDGSGGGHRWYEERLRNLERWIDRGAPLPPEGAP
jgi:hypothetical protein